jgi:hypothetical protein
VQITLCLIWVQAVQTQAAAVEQATSLFLAQQVMAALAL